MHASICINPLFSLWNPLRRRERRREKLKEKRNGIGRERRSEIGRGIGRERETETGRGKETGKRRRKNTGISTTGLIRNHASTSDQDQNL